MENITNNSDRIHRRLRNAFVELLAKKNYKSITVKELTDTAEMSRATFYLHYKDMSDFVIFQINILVKNVARQMIFWLDSGPENAYKVCKRKNLLLDEKEREFFTCCIKQVLYLSEKSAFEIIFPEFCSFVNKRFGASEKELQDSMEFHFFVRAFAVTLMESFLSYDSKRMAEELKYVFMIWNKLFPQYHL